MKLVISPVFPTSCKNLFFIFIPDEKLKSEVKSRMRLRSVSKTFFSSCKLLKNCASGISCLAIAPVKIFVVGSEKKADLNVVEIANFEKPSCRIFSSRRNTYLSFIKI